MESVSYIQPNNSIHRPSSKNSSPSMAYLYNWCEERFQIQSIGDDILSKYVPAHVNIFYCFGGLVLTAFILQAGSGMALTIYFRSTVIEAFASVEIIVSTVNLGWLIRSIHRWSSSIMYQALILHVFRVYLTGGFKKQHGHQAQYYPLGLQVILYHGIKYHFGHVR